MSSAANTSPTLGVMLRRGVVRCCPHCGDRRTFFVKWFVRRERCAGCGLRWERNYEGFMLGAMAISFITTGGSLLITMLIGVVSTYPEVPLVPVLGSTVAVTLLVGVFGYPISYTLWQAVDLYLRPISEDDGEMHARTILSDAPKNAAEAEGQGEGR
ncbi:MAG: hypothetical protein ACKOBR_07950 [Actinomycetota bacterium]